MAVNPLKSIFGKLVGLTRASSTFPTERLFAKGGFIGPAIYLHATEGSETKVDIQGYTDLETSSTGTAALAVRGHTIVSAGASSLYTLAGPPGAGVKKTLSTVSTSTASRQITSAASIVTGASVASDSGTVVASSSVTIITLNGQGQTIELLGLSTSAWLNTNRHGFSTAATPLTS